MSMLMDEEIKRWTARRNTALVLDIIQGKTSPPLLSLLCRHLPPNTPVHPSSALPATHFPVSA